MEPLALPMVTETSRRVKELIKALYREMAIPNVKSATKSSFLYPYKDTQTKPGRKTNHNESRHLVITSFSLFGLS